MADNEHTSKDIAAQASKVMTMSDEEIVSLAKDHPGVFRSIAASALTQTADREHGEH